MATVTIDAIKLIGLSLATKTTNENEQSHIDCKNLWHQFESANYIAVIPGKISSEIFGVYYDYEGDNTKPFNYFIGCKVATDAVIPDGLQSFIIPQGTYHKIVVTGKMPDCMFDAWKKVWTSNIERSYGVDFEVYDERSKDWNNAEVDIYLSIK